MFDIKARLLLLYFNNPECHACREMKDALEALGIVREKIKNGALKILSVYTDKDVRVWSEHLKEYPAAWIQGRDEGEWLYKHKVYDLSAIPTLYLLSKDKRVLLKDCTDLRELEARLKD